MSWSEDNKWESEWWGDCANTYGEETKQIVYASKMGLVAEWNNGHYPVYDLRGKSVLDIGGGPVSLLLKTINRKDAAVVDPCHYPAWIQRRYDDLKIVYYVVPAEDIGGRLDIGTFDEVWIYNVLQHTIDPKLIIDNAKKVSKIIRLFEWIDMPPEIGHPHTLTEEKLNTWLGGQGKVERLNTDGCHGKAYYGIFVGNE